MSVKIYAGLSLDEESARAILPDCRFAGPVRRGDLLGDIRAEVPVVVIIDGRFQQSLAVSVSEIMDALRCGMRVYGASSMGALRAAELGAYGMIGCGAIYELVAAERWFRDDYLGQVFAEGDWQSGSVPYINVHFGLAELCQRGDIDEAERELLDRLYRDLHFSERDAPSFKQAIADSDGPRQQVLLTAAEQALSHDQKRLDAVGVLEHVKADLEHIAVLNEQILKSMRESRYDERFDPSIEMHVGILLGP